MSDNVKKFTETLTKAGIPNLKDYAQEQYGRKLAMSIMLCDPIPIEVPDIKSVIRGVLKEFFSAYDLTLSPDYSPKDNWVKGNGEYSKITCNNDLTIETVMNYNFLDRCKNLSVKMTRRGVSREVFYSEDDLSTLGEDKFNDKITSDFEDAFFDVMVLPQGEIS